MSYAQAIRHSRNHRKDRFTQPIVHGCSVGQRVSQRNCVHVFEDIPDAYGGSYKLCLLCSKVERGLTMLAPDKGQAAVVKDNLVSAPCG